MSYSSNIEIQDYPLWQKLNNGSSLYAFDLEITARCNNNCRHCYINLPAGDREAQKDELTIREIDRIAGEAIDLGAMWCLITGGEPLIRPDFPEIYRLLKSKGLFVSIFTNATLINEKHIQLFKDYPPRDIEVTVYGATKETYEKITRLPGSYDNFLRGLDLLLNNNVKVRLKAMVLKDNLHEINEIKQFSIDRTKDYYRFDPVLHLRYDGNLDRNNEIKAQRLSPEEIVLIEKLDPDRFGNLEDHCDELFLPENIHTGCDHLFHCGIGKGNVYITSDGKLKLCSTLNAPGTVYDIRKGTIRDALVEFSPRIRDLRSNNPKFMSTCRKCGLVNLCGWCPATAYLETGKLDGTTEYFCSVAHAREKMLTQGKE